MEFFLGSASIRQAVSEALLGSAEEIFKECRGALEMEFFLEELAAFLGDIVLETWKNLLEDLLVQGDPYEHRNDEHEAPAIPPNFFLVFHRLRFVPLGGCEFHEGNLMNSAFWEEL